ncbi:MFS transporter [Terracoccus luteus]|uniref:DHA1 family inner membrane transport protein n=1 Tax=Terracoccus luteus TaxID=53356 RepID=A0A839PLE7_9MICO|nr:MFS transporter [Terracoccus luteus]MBB2985090.1 DHA1 family inner membrane transport protein [Terracoccus luteus]MCP2170742.1 DHA1 family inner membrane transport protein [Terracoccus luteus]
MSTTQRRTALAIVAIALGGFAIGTTEFVTMGLLPQIADGTGVDIPTAGHYVSAYALGVVVGAPLIAVLAARVPRKALLMALMAVFAVSHLATTFVDTYPSLLAVRFVSGLPHGAYFGIGALVAASLVSRERRTAAIATILGGLGVANVLGVPLATLLGQRFSWHLPYVAVGVVGLVTVVAVGLLLPRQAPEQVASMRTELSALRRGQVWLALLIGTVGFGGMFAMYSYITPTMTELTGLAESAVPWVLMAYGIGMVTGMVLAGRVAARFGVMRGILVSMVAIAVLLGLFGTAAHVVWAAVAFVFLLGLVPSIVVPLLQTRLMDVARDGQSLAATLNHSTLNIANALGAWLGSLVLTAGYGYGAPSLVGAGLAVLGVGIAALSAGLERRDRRRGVPASRPDADAAGSDTPAPTAVREVTPV